MAKLTAEEVLVRVKGKWNRRGVDLSFLGMFQRASAIPNSALSAARRTSHYIARLKPPAIQSPLMAPMMGFHSSMLSLKCCPS